MEGIFGAWMPVGSCGGRGTTELGQFTIGNGDGIVGHASPVTELFCIIILTGENTRVVVLVEERVVLRGKRKTQWRIFSLKTK